MNEESMMEQISENILIKSEKISQKKKIRIAWIISTLIIVITLTFLIIDYSSYKKGQQFGLSALYIASETAGTRVIYKNDPYEEQCNDAYLKLYISTPDFTVFGTTIDNSELRRTEDALRSSFATVMKAAGFERYSSYNIYKWFEYTNIWDYFIGYYQDNLLPKCCYIVLILTIVFTILVSREGKKELVVYEDSILCKVNSKRSKQLFFDDINNVDFGKKALTIVGPSMKFKISNLSNAEDLKSIIIEKKKSSQSKTKTDSSTISSADELKKYKELLDNGVISQDEFDSKKKQLLGF